MPYLGLTSFLRELSIAELLKDKGVNALSRAHVISTGYI